MQRWQEKINVSVVVGRAKFGQLAQAYLLNEAKTKAHSTQELHTYLVENYLLPRW